MSMLGLVGVRCRDGREPSAAQRRSVRSAMAAAAFAVVGVLAAPLVAAGAYPVRGGRPRSGSGAAELHSAIILLVTLTRLLYRQTSSRPDKPRVCTLPARSVPTCSPPYDRDTARRFRAACRPQRRRPGGVAAPPSRKMALPPHPARMLRMRATYASRGKISWRYRGATQSIGPKGFCAPTNGPLVTGSGRLPWPKRSRW